MKVPPSTQATASMWANCTASSWTGWTFRVTHVVVDIGPLRAGRALLRQGLAAEYDRVVPIDSLEATPGERIQLNMTESEFMKQPEYTAEQYETPHDLTPNRLEITDVIRAEQRFGSLLPGGDASVFIVTKLNKTKNERDVAEGTPVWRRTPHEKIGEVDRLLLDEHTDRVQAFVIKRGFLFKREVMLPVRYVTELLDDLIHVEISDAELAQLKPYEQTS